MGKGYKVVVCGMASVGKTAILEQVLYGHHRVGSDPFCEKALLNGLLHPMPFRTEKKGPFLQEQREESSEHGVECFATIEDVYVALVETDRGVKEQLRLYDTKGLQGGEEFPQHYFSIADGFILVYAVNSRESFEIADSLKKEMDKFRDKKEGSIVVLGNKTDLEEERQVETEVAQQWARMEKVKLWEVMATDGKTLVEPLTVLASKLSQSQNKSAFPLPGRKTKGNNDDS